MTTHVDTIERTSIVTYALLQQLHEALADPKGTDDVTLGMLMGLSMFLDEKIGPFRARKLMIEAPTIVLKTDAHVTGEQMTRFAPVLRAFAEHLLEETAAVRQHTTGKIV